MSPRLWQAVLAISLVGGTLKAQVTPAPGPGEIRLTYIGNAGWEITDGKTVVLVDPFLTQFSANRDWKPGQPVPTERPLDAPCVPDAREIDEHIHQADYIIVTHGHPDHAMDAPYIAKKTGATIIGSESVANLARTFAVPEKQLIVVRGGEDYDFGTFSLKVIPSIHSALYHKHYFTRGDLSGEVPRGLKPPAKCGDFQEGGSLAYLLRIAGHQVLAMGSMNYIEREMEGLRPDVALVGANNNRKEIYDYAGRLMRALGNPPLVMPSHWDQYGWAPDQPKAHAEAERFAAEVTSASPKSRVLIPKHFEPITVPAR